MPRKRAEDKSTAQRLFLQCAEAGPASPALAAGFDRLPERYKREIRLFILLTKKKSPEAGRIKRYIQRGELDRVSELLRIRLVSDTAQG